MNLKYSQLSQARNCLDLDTVTIIQRGIYWGAQAISMTLKAQVTCSILKVMATFSSYICPCLLFYFLISFSVFQKLNKSLHHQILQLCH